MKSIEAVITEAYNEVTKEDFTPESTQAALEKLAAEVRKIALDGDDMSKVWLNAMGCVSPSPDFAEEVGRSLIRDLMAAPQPEPDEFGLRPFRQLYVRVVCS